MTEEDDGARIDFSAIAPREPGLEDRVVNAAMQRVRAALRSTMNDLARLWRPGLAAAAVFTLLAVGSLLTMSSRVATDDAIDTPEAALIQWAANEHVPSNGELLVAFSGYRP
jgi:hypothetical protein